MSSKTAENVLKAHPQTFAEEAGIRVKNTPAPLFQALVMSLLCSARISSDQAIRASGALFDAGWTTPEKMAEATWKQRVDVLNQNGYARYDEKTSRMLQDTCDLLLEKYGGDLRNMRDEAERDPKEEGKLIREFKGIGDVGANIFFRDVQTEWEEHFPFADDPALEAAKELDLPASPEKLADLVPKNQFPAIVDGLVRVKLEGNYDELRG